MGLFLHDVIFLNCTEETARAAIAEAAGEDFALQPEACFYKTENGGVNVLLSDMCAGYEPLAKYLSEKTQKPVMLLYIYDDDYWGYYFYENGRELDSYNPMPDLLEDVPDEEWQRLAGRASVVAAHFGIEPETIARYLIPWTEEIYDGDGEPAYPDDKYAAGDSWQIVNFMAKLGFSYGWE